jgi:hypothetical protein
MRELELIQLAPLTVTTLLPAVGAVGFSCLGLNIVLVKFYTDANRTEFAADPAEDKYTYIRLPDNSWMTYMGLSFSGTDNHSRPGIRNSGGLLSLPPGISRCHICHDVAETPIYYDVWGAKLPFIGTGTRGG